MGLRLSKRLLTGLVAVSLVALGLWATSDRAPRMPGDGDHAIPQSESQCLSCHGRAGQRPRPVDHPLRDDCYSCHRDAAGTLHPREDAPTEIPGGWRDNERQRSR